MARLRQSAQIINRREGVQPSELKRVREALLITAEPNAVANSNAVHGIVYEKFLCKVSQVAGPQMVVICAIGLGRAVVKVLKDRIRVDLPFELKEQAATLASEVIQGIVDKHTPKGATGYVEDAIAANIYKHKPTFPKLNHYLQSTPKPRVHRAGWNKINSR